MAQLDPLIFREISAIQKIIQDETWLEGERRGCFVSSDDSSVRERVCDVILRIGRELRESLTAQISSNSRPPEPPVQFPKNDQAA